MANRFTRRALLSGLGATLATPALALAPTRSLRPVPRGAAPIAVAPPEYASLIRDAGLGGQVTFAVADAKTGAFIETHNADVRLPAASVAKAATAYYALDRLGPEYRFVTRVLATAPIVNGRLDGDLILEGGGDPTLDTDAMADLVLALKATGLIEVRGALRIDARALPNLPWIDPDQPDHVSYNPAIAGLNLNFNRVHFEWKRAKDGYDITMQARARRFRPAVDVATMSLEDRKMPVYTYERRSGVDRWTVAKGALGRDGARWLPVRDPAAYAADVFMTLARSNGIVLRRGPNVLQPVAATELVAHESAPLTEIAADMLEYSTNLTAESLGITASRNGGARPPSLIRSAREMNKWLNGAVGARSAGFVDHSGLGYGSRVTAQDMVRILQSAAGNGALKPLLKDIKVEAPGAVVRAKTGTLNFVSGLAGYVDAPNGRSLTFAIFSADLERRDAIDVANRERPPGARSWARRARGLQKSLIGRWLALSV